MRKCYWINRIESWRCVNILKPFMGITEIANWNQSPNLKGEWKFYFCEGGGGLLCSSIEYDLLYFWSMMNQLYNMNYYIKWTWTKHWTRGKWDIPRSSSHMMFFHANITQVFNGIKYVWDHFLDFENFKHFTVMGHHMKNIISFHNYIPNSYCQTLWPCSFFIDGKL